MKALDGKKDMLDVLDGPPRDHLLQIPAGQPFRLCLWHTLAQFLSDPDADFLLNLVHGVPLGVNGHLRHGMFIMVWSPIRNLLVCHDSWKSAYDHPAIVEDLIQEELAAGFIALVPGGVPELLLWLSTSRQPCTIITIYLFAAFERV